MFMTHLSSHVRPVIKVQIICSVLVAVKPDKNMMTTQMLSGACSPYVDLRNLLVVLVDNFS